MGTIAMVKIPYTLPRTRRPWTSETASSSTQSLQLADDDVLPRRIIDAPAERSDISEYIRSGKATVRIALPDGRQFTYLLDSRHTFWWVYSTLAADVPELPSTTFTIELSNGHTLSEREFNL